MPLRSTPSSRFHSCGRFVGRLGLGSLLALGLGSCATSSSPIVPSHPAIVATEREPASPEPTSDLEPLPRTETAEVDGVRLRVETVVDLPELPIYVLSEEQRSALTDGRNVIASEESLAELLERVRSLRLDDEAEEAFFESNEYACDEASARIEDAGEIYLATMEEEPRRCFTTFLVLEDAASGDLVKSRSLDESCDEVRVSVNSVVPTHLADGRAVFVVAWVAVELGELSDDRGDCAWDTHVHHLGIVDTRGAFLLDESTSIRIDSCGESRERDEVEIGWERDGTRSTRDLVGRTIDLFDPGVETLEDAYADPDSYEEPELPEVERTVRPWFALDLGSMPFDGEPDADDPSRCSDADAPGAGLGPLVRPSSSVRTTSPRRRPSTVELHTDAFLCDCGDVERCTRIGAGLRSAGLRRLEPVASRLLIEAYADTCDTMSARACLEVLFGPALATVPRPEFVRGLEFVCRNESLDAACLALAALTFEASPEAGTAEAVLLEICEQGALLEACVTLGARSSHDAVKNRARRALCDTYRHPSACRAIGMGAPVDRPSNPRDLYYAQPCP